MPSDLDSAQGAGNAIRRGQDLRSSKQCRAARTSQPVCRRAAPPRSTRLTVDGECGVGNAEEVGARCCRSGLLRRTRQSSLCQRSQPPNFALAYGNPQSDRADHCSRRPHQRMDARRRKTVSGYPRIPGVGCCGDQPRVCHDRQRPGLSVLGGSLPPSSACDSSE